MKLLMRFNKCFFGYCSTAIFMNMRMQWFEFFRVITVQEIIPFIDEHWEQLTNAPRRVKHTWHSSIAKTMVRFFLPFCYC